LPAGEKAALAARLARLKESGADELREKAELQEALVRCGRHKWGFGSSYVRMAKI
jgi:hypothetical protein